MKKIEVYYEQGGYYTGEINTKGNIELYDLDNNYWTGTIEGRKVEIYDNENTYYYGELKSDGKISFYSS
jgi:hypothetical protein